MEGCKVLCVVLLAELEARLAVSGDVWGTVLEIRDDV
jgi:hypothetical protein